VPEGSLTEGQGRHVEAGLREGMPVRIFNGHLHLPQLLLVLSETGIALLSVYGAVLTRFYNYSQPIGAFHSTVGPVWPRALAFASVMLLALASLGLYQIRQRNRFSGVLVRLLIAVLLAQAAIGLIFYLSPALYVGRGVIGLAGMFSFLGLALNRYLFLRIVDEDIFKRRLLVWGAGARAATNNNSQRRRSDQRGFKIVGFVRAPGDGMDVPDCHIVRPERGLVRLAMHHKVEEIVVAPDDRRGGLPTAELLECRIHGIEVCDVLAFFERESGRVDVELMQPSWLIFSKGFRTDVVRVASKRLFDIVVSIGILVSTLPIAVLTSVAIFLEDRKPVLYRQIRVGRYGRPFSMLKFRSMRVDAESNGEAVWAARNDSRVTRVGAVIRKFRIDELPQVLNVLVGHMSFVGPRPERPEFVKELAKVIPYYPERHSVKPGITGWAQVCYSYGSSENDARGKLEYDLYYVKNHSLVFDLMVLLQTVEVVLFRMGSR
jgi:sugar transferase (PEP-CTERM system associated)